MAALNPGPSVVRDVKLQMILKPFEGRAVDKGPRMY
jgi:hypothetical protein